ncbi:MAG: hypothetical protein Q4E09_00665, partial [Eubacteriales bacterium]|nr:hypothetical protein [Eubacteriales bacterium]
MKKTNALLSILLTLVLCFSSLAFMSNFVEAAVEGTINVYTRDSASGTREGFEGVIGFKGELTDAANE